MFNGNPMESLYILIPIAVVFIVIAIIIFFWAVKSGQYEDLENEGKRILFDEKQFSTDNRNSSKKSKSQNE